MSIGKFLQTCLDDAHKALHALSSFFGAAKPYVDQIAVDTMPLIRAIDPQAAAYADIAVKLFDAAAGVAKNADGSITVTHSVEVANQIEQLVKDAKSWIGAAGASPTKP